MTQCHATSKGSGKPCQRQAVAGATVCRVHGGAAPQVKNAARLRLLALVDPALATLARAVKGKGKPNGVEIRAATEILNRVGMDLAGAEAGAVPPANITIRFVRPEDALTPPPAVQIAPPEQE